MGCIYRRNQIYWIKYYRHGKPYVESTHTKKKEVARRVLRQREGEISKGAIPGICFDKIRFEELAEDFLADYRINEKKTLKRAEFSKANLSKFFGGMRITEITTDLIKAYIEGRRQNNLSNASINRELAALKRMLRLGLQSTPPKVGQVPYIPMLKESNIRKGFFEHEEFLALRNALPYPINSIATFAYFSGWRRSEILGLSWDRVDLKLGIVRLNPGETKNDDARTVYMNETLLAEMQFLHMNRISGCPFVFHRDGKAVKNFRDAWKAACKAVNLEGRIFHDFRRTAVRNMIRAGIPERVAMEISGHRTRSIFDRYHIVSPDDLKEASRKQEIFLESQGVTENGYNLVTIGAKMRALQTGGKKTNYATA